MQIYEISVESPLTTKQPRAIPRGNVETLRNISVGDRRQKGSWL